MSYIIGQYNHNNASSDDSSFITPITSGTVSRRNSSSSSSSSLVFSDECITNLSLTTSKNYYLRCQIKKMTSTQTFNVKLVNFNNISEKAPEQYIKQITIEGGSRQEWVNVEFVFHPVVAFDTILFQLQRTSQDYQDFPRYPKIDYQQLGSINNIINSKIGSNVSLLKIGVQSHPGLMMCINNEEIHLSRSGIFEFKNENIPIIFFSVVNPAIEVNQSTSDINSVEGWKLYINQQIENIENDPSLTPQQKENMYKAINSKCFFGTSKTYKIDAFTLDYMYDN